MAGSNSGRKKETEKKEPIMQRSRYGGTVDTNPDYVKDTIKAILKEYENPPVKSDNELYDRIQQYFDTCAELNSAPTVESLVLYCGYSHWWYWDVLKGLNPGFSGKTKDILQKATTFVAAFDAKALTDGRMNFLAYCFRAKNYYGMRDRVEFNITAEQESVHSIEDISAKYNDIIDVEPVPIEEKKNDS